MQKLPHHFEDMPMIEETVDARKEKSNLDWQIVVKWVVTLNRLKTVW